MYSLCGSELNDVNVVRDLGIYASNNMSPPAHCANIASLVNRRIFCFCKAFRSTDLELMLNLYKTYIRALLESNVVLFSHYLVKDIDLLENCQRRFTKLIAGFYDINYDDKLRLLQLPKLNDRRLCFDIIFLYKIIYGLVDLDFESFLVGLLTPAPEVIL